MFKIRKLTLPGTGKAACKLFVIGLFQPEGQYEELNGEKERKDLVNNIFFMMAETGQKQAKKMEQSS
jgi:hypothetical protein